MSPGNTRNSPSPRAAPCPICGRPAIEAQRPFCSARCRTVDLGRWLNGTYRIETDDVPEDGAAGTG